MTRSSNTDKTHRLNAAFHLLAQGYTLAEAAGAVRPQGQLINRVKVPVGVCHNAVAESNCVIVRWGGEQLEAKGQSAG